MPKSIFIYWNANVHEARYGFGSCARILWISRDHPWGKKTTHNRTVLTIVICNIVNKKNRFLFRRFATMPPSISSVGFVSGSEKTAKQTLHRQSRPFMNNKIRFIRHGKSVSASMPNTSDCIHSYNWKTIKSNAVPSATHTDSAHEQNSKPLMPIDDDWQCAYLFQFALLLRPTEKLISQTKQCCCHVSAFQIYVSSYVQLQLATTPDQTQNDKFHIGRVMFGSLNWMAEQIENVYDFCTLCYAFATQECQVGTASPRLCALKLMRNNCVQIARKIA